jgi:hypothetical protein
MFDIFALLGCYEALIGSHRIFKATHRSRRQRSTSQATCWAARPSEDGPDRLSRHVHNKLPINAV